MMWLLLLCARADEGLEWSEPRLWAPFSATVMTRFWSQQPADLADCLAEPVELRMVIDHHCAVRLVEGSACLDEMLRGQKLPAHYCGCGFSIVEQTLWRR